MSHTPHELAAEFPDKVAVISALKASDRRFARLTERYHEVNRAVHRAEVNAEPISQEAETILRKKRAALKDEIWSILSAA
ncbi:DUF465 domain-containing protein [Epibacterium ulvae]|uniref:YdcH family protein n=1 Tax=Epibacterium ulvae TaxID=1156985 RepID=UPI001BFCB89C|nr:DUF465 domain-containing protein [Epibacterium ulvae]MBT8155558.1 DUF465 domain-containing protein [Epibacterium ulvae]